MLWYSAGAQHGGDKDARTMGIRLPNAATDGDAGVVWESDRAVATCVSPILYQEHVYTLTYNGILTKYVAESGRVQKKKRMRRGQWFAALLAGDGRIYASNDRGETVVIDPETLEMISENDLGESIYAGPAIAGNRLLIRTVNRLFCVEPQSQETSAAPISE
jgi:hypothetical protein